MNKHLLFFFLLFVLARGTAQVISMPSLLNAVSVSDSRCDNFINQKGFVKSGNSSFNDTMVSTYFFKGKSKRKRTTGVTRSITRISSSTDIRLVYETEAAEEYKLIREQLDKAGYWIRSKGEEPEFYQFRDTEIETLVKTGEDTVYQVNVIRRILPLPRYIINAEDLLSFNSHEQLLYLFGENNVKKDMYYFSETEFSHCSVLFPHTSRQAVFIWQDELNARVLGQVIIGGQLMTEALMDFAEPVPENTWHLRNGIHTGMSLQELRKINGNNLSFYGGASRYTGKIIPSPGDKVDFKKHEIVLNCLNCASSPFIQKNELSADETFQDGSRFFVFSIILNRES